MVATAALIGLGAVGAGGAYYIATRNGGAAVPTSTVPTTPTRRSGGGFLGPRASVGGFVGVDLPATSDRVTAATLGARDHVTKQALDYAEQKAREKYNELSTQAKRDAAKAVNEKLGTNLTGDESYEELVRTLSGAGADKLCQQSEYTAWASGTLCTVVGEYLGGKVGDWLKEEVWPHVSDWASDAWDSTRSAVEDIYDSTIGRIF